MIRALRMPLLATALALGVVPMSACAQNTSANPIGVSSDGTLLSVSAQADSKRVPDIATISTGVVTQAADANGALRSNADQMSKVVAAIKAAGIADRDIQTGGVNLNPQYRYGENVPPAITGYQASNNVNLVVRDIAKLGKILDALVATGANQINGPTFDVDKKDAAYDEARRAALEKAQGRAEMYAKTLGLKVRRIVSISEGGRRGGVPAPMMFGMERQAKAASADTPIEAGETALSVELEIVFELGK